MFTVCQRHHPMKGQPRWPAPHQHVAMRQPQALRLVAALWPTE
jgi:hypothetical protein